MARPIHPPSVALLRAITLRLTSTPSHQLPHIAQQLAGSLWSCKDILSTPSDALQSQRDIANIIHRFKTSLSSLLQDRSIEVRWAAVVLVKAAIEAGGVEILSRSNAWVRSLLGILKKSDPPTTRKLAIILLTRIFILTWNHPNLVREITTPALPTFISSCLGTIEKERCSSSELHSILEAYAILVPRHPTVFRTYEGQIRGLLIRILSSTSLADGSITRFSHEHIHAAQRLWVLLHHCAPKQGGGERWDEGFKATVTAAHATCDRLFRSVVENWQSVADVQQSVPTSTLLGVEVRCEGEDAVGLGEWHEVDGGSERLICLLQLLESHLSTVTTNIVTVRIGLVFDLLARLFSLTAESVKANAQIPKDERESMFSTLPGVQIAALDLANTLLLRFRNASVPFLQNLSELIVDVYRAEHWDVEIRTATYTVFRNILKLIGPSFSKEDIVDFTPLIKGCCEDLVPTKDERLQRSVTKANGISTSPSVNLETMKAQPNHPILLAGLDHAATALLPVLFTNISPGGIPRKLRVQLERTSILTRNKEALVACVLNPAKKDNAGGAQTSLLPLLAREFPDSPEVEALLRPRMPAIRTQAVYVGEDVADGENEEDVDEGEYFDNVIGHPAEELDEEDGPMSGDSGIDEATDRAKAPSHADNMKDVTDSRTHSDHIATAGDDESDLYSATPERKAASSIGSSPTHNETAGSVMKHDHDNGGTKRPATESAFEPVSSKRLRASPAAEALAEGSSRLSAAPRLDAASAETQLPIITTINEGTNTEEQQVAETLTLPSQSRADGNSDDSDFEMPPLTLEPDTDPEDEEEDEEDG